MRAIILTNIAVFVLTLAAPDRIIGWFGLVPEDIIQRGRLWELVTYLFVHSPGDLMHILFNMLAVWMFGTDLERRWGSRGFTKYYFVTGVGAGICQTVLSLVPWAPLHSIYNGPPTIGASGSCPAPPPFGSGALFPSQILFIFFFLRCRRGFVLIMGLIALISADRRERGGPAVRTSRISVACSVLMDLPEGPTDPALRRHALTKWHGAHASQVQRPPRGRDDDWERGAIHLAAEVRVVLLGFAFRLRARRGRPSEKRRAGDRKVGCPGRNLEHARTSALSAVSSGSSSRRAGAEFTNTRSSKRRYRGRRTPSLSAACGAPSADASPTYCSRIPLRR